MTRPFFFSLLLLATLAAANLSPVAASDESAEANAPTAEKNKNAKKGKKKVATALKDLKYLTEARPNPKAKYYIYLQSASWCGPCNAEMPTIAEEYKEMEASGKVDLILLSADRSADAAKAFLEKYGATFPVVMGRDVTPETLPGYTRAGGIPHAAIVTAKGDVLKEGHGSIVAQWRDVCKIKSASSSSKKMKQGKKGKKEEGKEGDNDPKRDKKKA